jgi:hypothetical protein
MTPQTAHELAELGITPEVEAAFDYVENSSPGRLNAAPATEPQTRTRRVRSDKGTIRPVKAEPAKPVPVQAGGITEAQANTLKRLISETEDARSRSQAASAAFAKASAELDAFVDSLTK